MSAYTIRVGTQVVTIRDSSASNLLQDFAARYPQVSAQSDLEIYLDHQAGLVCEWWHAPSSKAINLNIDINSFVSQQRSFPAAKHGAFNQALGRKTRNIIDATGGWGGDALLMCSQGYRVVIIERHPLMALFLREAMLRLANSVWAHENAVAIPCVVESDASVYLETTAAIADCIYLDPMFPPKRKTSAATNKYMQFLHYLLGAEGDSADLASAALATQAPRVVVKRPHYAASLLAASPAGKQLPTQQFGSKLVHYDVYLTQSSI